MARYTFDEIQDEVLRSLGIKPGDESTQQLDSIKLRINMIQDYIFFHRTWEWRKRDWFMTTRTPYATGTISTTQGSRTVTGSGTTWVDNMKVGYLSVDGRLYRIDRVASGTSIILRAPFDRTALSAATYKIVYPQYALPSLMASLLAIVYEGKELLVSQKNQVDLIRTESVPEEVYLGDINDTTFYSTGTVDVTVDSASVTGNSTVFTALMEGMQFQVAGNSEIYTIRERTSDTAITLDRPYTGATATTQNYTINAIGTPLMTFVPYPDDYYTLRIEGLIRPQKLVNTNDLSLIPDHTPLLLGAIWLAKVEFEEASPFRIQQSEADFIKSLRLLEDHYKAIPAPRWLNESNFVARHVGRTPTFNPLERRNPNV